MRSQYFGKFQKFLLVLIIIGAVLLATQKLWLPKLTSHIVGAEEKKTEQDIVTKEKANPGEVSIRVHPIKEENFTGTMPTISGTSVVADAAQTFIKEKVDEFRKQADADVPDMRAKFGADSPTAHYTIDVGAIYLKSKKTETIATNTYAYTGGANGNSSYKVFTASLPEGKALSRVLSLSDVIRKDKQAAFTALVKKQLNDWRPQGMTTTVVFPDQVKALSFSSFANWSLDEKNFAIYFDKYDIGPGSLGAVIFQIPLDKLKDMLEPSYL